MHKGADRKVSPRAGQRDAQLNAQGQSRVGELGKDMSYLLAGMDGDKTETPNANPANPGSPKKQADLPEKTDTSTNHASNGHKSDTNKVASKSSPNPDGGKDAGEEKGKSEPTKSAAKSDSESKPKPKKMAGSGPTAA